MKILGSSHAKEVHIHGLKEAIWSACCWILGTSVKAVEFVRFGNLHVLNNTLARVLTKLSSITPDAECVGCAFENLEWLHLFLGAIDLCHAFNFNEFHVVTILVRMSFLWVAKDETILLLSDVANDALLW